MDAWRLVWREGIAPQLGTDELKLLRTAFENHDRRLVQGSTTIPLEEEAPTDTKPCGACMVAYVAWLMRGNDTIGEVLEQFNHFIFEANRRCRPLRDWGTEHPAIFFTGWFDATPMETVRKEMIDEITLELNARGCDEMHDMRQRTLETVQ